jgi:amino acid permease
MKLIEEFKNSGSSSLSGTPRGGQNGFPDEIHINTSGKKTSWLGTYGFLTKSMLGAGMLQLASVCAAYGSVLGVILCIFAACMTIVALFFNAQLAKDHPGKVISFYTVSKHVSPATCWLIDIACILDCFGASISYIQTTGLMLSPTLLVMTGWDISNESLMLYIKIATVVVLAPFCFLRGISHASILSYIGIACITYVCIMPFIYLSDNPASVVIPVWPNSFLGAMRKLPVYFFAFSCMQNLFTVVNEIENFTVRRVQTVCACAVSTGLVLYLVVMLVPFISFGSSVKDVFLESYEPNRLGVQLAYILTALQVSIGYVLVIHPTRQSILSLWYRESEPAEGNERKLRLIITLGLVVATMGVALLTNSISTVTELTGLFGANTYCFTAPSYMFYKRYHPRNFKGESTAPNGIQPHLKLWYLSVGCLVISALIYPICTTAIIYGMVTGDPLVQA